jgi:short-subunit dehydrogenase
MENPGPGAQTALVTGATSGLGRAIAIALARDGFEVVVHGRDAGRGARAIEQIEMSGGRARFAAADLSDPNSIERLAADAGQVDVLVNNAGFSWFGSTAGQIPATRLKGEAHDRRAARPEHRLR